jgi:DNA-directed RNA polymerase specialized sigma24 family protein
MQGHQDAPGVTFEEFVDVEMSRLLRLGYALTGSPHDAWDLTQDTPVKVGAHWSRLMRTESGGQYARTTMIRLNVNRWRRGRHEVLGEPPPAP